ncbi:hypothetical protein M2137_001781 [Parabacteroides sp. PFB2-10]|uniref:hypothetical protein n=1 Tax=Parabacteroides sp. PFB2-10 TaxID=1742405 RepID=UPI0024741C00|nr:hypothetical protein [Parabacteroides sp. PFB2-10]MDH6312994.1 hypothetical protein [Parabacteroides sp. PFB2-10]
MDGSQLRNLIGQKRPRYKEQYRTLIESISKKGDASGEGGFSSFGAFYQTFMYAFFVGYKLQKCIYIQPNEPTTDFIASFELIKPTPVRDFIIMLLLNETEKFNFTWFELENANEETIDNFITELFRQMEGYANAGFEYLQNKWNEEKIEYQDPFVFVNFLEELN